MELEQITEITLELGMKYAKQIAEDILNHLRCEELKRFEVNYQDIASISLATAAFISAVLIKFQHAFSAFKDQPILNFPSLLEDFKQAVIRNLMLEDAIKIDLKINNFKEK